MATTYTMRMDEGAKALISEFAKANGESMAEFMTRCALDVIEDELDVRDADEAYLEYLANPVTYTHEELMREYGLS